MTVVLRAIDGPDEGRTFEYQGYGPIVFGRAGTPDRREQRPSDPEMSREHVLLDVTRDNLWAEAINRDTGFELGGRSVLDAELRSGDTIRLGSTLFEVQRTLEIKGDAGTEADLTLDDAIPQRRLAEFTIGREIGRGGLGIVYEAVDKETGETLAIKQVRTDMPLDNRALQYFLREMAIVSELRHPNVVRTYSIGSDSGVLFFVMERVPGKDLDRRMRETGPLTVFQAAELGIGMLRALAYTHGKGVVHRDIKPSNVMLCDTAQGLTVHVVDFGMAKRFGDVGATSITRTGEPRGTLLFASPECLRDAKRARPPADVYSVGATLYYALTGMPYFDRKLYGRNVYPAVLGARVVPLRERRDDVPAALAEVIESTIREDPRDRPASAADMLRQLILAASTIPKD